MFLTYNIEHLKMPFDQLCKEKLWGLQQDGELVFLRNNLYYHSNKSKTLSVKNLFLKIQLSKKRQITMT